MLLKPDVRKMRKEALINEVLGIARDMENPDRGLITRERLETLTVAELKEALRGRGVTKLIHRFRTPPAYYNY